MTPDFLREYEFFTGVPDSQLKALCDYLLDLYGTDPRHHIIAANEGNAVALAAGYHLATGNVPVVYLQNSGLGNIINPVASLLNEKVYGIPCLFVVGWRGEPGVHDEPQHVFQGEITLPMLRNLDIPATILDKTTTRDELAIDLQRFKSAFSAGRSAAIVVRKGALAYDKKTTREEHHTLLREDVIRLIVAAAGGSPIVSTTGKTSRELFEIREQNGQSHQHDFLTVGSMGHCSSIALGIALQKRSQKIWCIDGDGAVLMHMGALGAIGASAPKNLVHIVINNEAHESVGGQPNAVSKINLPGVALACGYADAFSVAREDELSKALTMAGIKDGPIFIEVKCRLGSRADLGRPTRTPGENKIEFMMYLDTEFQNF